MLNNFGQTFKDNGYQLGNDRDAPIYQEPSYWPIMFRTQAFWHRESNNRQAVDAIPGNPGSGLVESSVTSIRLRHRRSRHDHRRHALQEHFVLRSAIYWQQQHLIWPRRGHASTISADRTGSISSWESSNWMSRSPKSARSSSTTPGGALLQLLLHSAR